MSQPTSDDTFVCITRGHRSESRKTPLVLIHDGGGTIINYFKLGDLGRDVYGIYDPLFQRSIPWEGGIPAMAEAYCKMVQRHLSHTQILLGGWSLGGLIAFEMSKILTSNSSTHVIGLLMIESLNPQSKFERLESSWKDRDQMLSVLQPRSREIVQQSLDQAYQMIDSWDPEASHHGFVERPPTQSNKRNAHTSKSQRSQSGIFAPPPAILLRAEEDQKTRGGGWYPQMGWEIYPMPFVREVKNTPGRHFTIFEPINLSALCRTVADSCASLETASFQSIEVQADAT